MNVQPVNPKEFVQAVKPLLEAKDLTGLHKFLCDRFTAEQITDLLSCKCQDARNVAALALSLVGGKCCIEPLAARLKDPDPVVNQIAEHALWNIWFRGSTEPANHQLCRGIKALDSRDFDHALQHFNDAIQIDSNFAEAYNQRAIAWYLQERYEESIQDCLETVKRMPCHFGAWSGLGHSFAHVGRFADALESYEKALSINPHSSCVREAVHELKRKLGG